MARAGERASGILLHITSLPSRGGVGDLGAAAYAFADFLAAAKQRVWQVLPLSPTGYGNSPYSALSAFAGNPLLISLDTLAQQGWIAHDRLNELPGADGPAEFDLAREKKTPLLEEAAANFLARASKAQLLRYNKFVQANASWLTDYAAFAVLRRRFGNASWNTWPQEFAFRDPEAMAALRRAEAQEIAKEQACQFFFDEQWSGLRAYCTERDISILGDVAIFVNYDSVDVWVNPGIFELNDKLEPIRVAGVPPDYFSATGQRWGNPLYRWDVLQERSFDWWVARVRRSLALYDSIRLDHFRGFDAYWAIPATEATAVKGEWVKAPGAELFRRLKRMLRKLPFVAEDLGVITPDVEKLRDEFDMPGMVVLQFGFADRGGHKYLPHQCERNSVIYTGTHDNDTTLGWWRKTNENERRNFQTYLQKIEFDGDAVWALMRAAARSVAETCIFPLQDVLFLGSEARMNTPGVDKGNWGWRYAQGALHPDIAAQLAALMEMTDRDGYVQPPEPDIEGMP